VIAGTLVVDLTRHVDAFGTIPAPARMSVGTVLASAPTGAKVRVEVGSATFVDPAVERVLVDYAPRHDMEICGARPATVARLVRALRGESDELGGAA